MWTVSLSCILFLITKLMLFDKKKNFPFNRLSKHLIFHGEFRKRKKLDVFKILVACHLPRNI